MPTWKSEYRHVQDLYVISAPSGFKFFIEGTFHLLDLEDTLSRRGAHIYTSLSERLYLAPDGTITVVESDAWENPDFKPGDEITNAPALSGAIINIIKKVMTSKWDQIQRELSQ